MMKSLLVIFAACCGAAILAAQTPSAPANPLARHYREGETLRYQMTAVNEDWHYQVQADGVVKKNSDSSFVEEFRWSNMTSGGQPVALAPSNADFRQVLSLDPSHIPAPSDLTKADPRLIGPITDLMTFYVDLWLANKVAPLHHAGDHFYMPNGTPSSWADGTRVILGESAIDFDLTLQSLDPVQKTAVLRVRHVPPQKSSVRLDADWMRTPVADTPNNWVELTRTKDEKYEAGVGKETFDVAVTVSTLDGKILKGSLDNIVHTVHRTCDDAALTHCGETQPHTIHRHIEIALQP